MSVCTKIKLPEDVRVRHVAKVIGILFGLPKRWHKHTRDTKWVVVDGVWVEGRKDIPESCDIVLKGEMFGRDTCYSFGYYFESSEPSGRVMCLDSTPLAIALGQGLCKFFGGKLHYTDVSDVVDEEFPKPRSVNNPEDSLEWDEFQQDLWKVKKLTKKAIKEVAEFAAYQEFPWEE